jgi:AAA+ superfamily predicted ATPase
MSNRRFTGTGKTLLAREIARSLARPLYEWHIKATSKVQQGCTSRASSWANGCLR